MEKRIAIGGTAAVAALYCYYYFVNTETEVEVIVTESTPEDAHVIESDEVMTKPTIKKHRSSISEPTVTQLWIYPVKSLAGIRVTSATVEDRGFKYDRRWMVVSENGSFMSQRRCPKMALIHVLIIENYYNNVAIELTVLKKTIQVPLLLDPAFIRTKPVRVWDDSVYGVHDQGEAVARWLETVLEEPGVRLVYMGDECKRRVDPRYSVGNSNITSFSDGFPYLLISQASLNDLNHRIYMNHHKARVISQEEESIFRPLGMDRFRPNIVVTGLRPYEEDELSTIVIEDITFHVVKPCSRCKMTTIDQKTGIAPPSLHTEPLITLQGYRLQGEDVYLGQNLISTTSSGQPSSINVGDSFETCRKPK